MRNRFGAPRFATIYPVSPRWLQRTRRRGAFTRSASRASKSPLCRTCTKGKPPPPARPHRSEEHTSELQSRLHLVCRLLLEKKKKKKKTILRSVIANRMSSRTPHAISRKHDC